MKRLFDTSETIPRADLHPILAVRDLWGVIYVRPRTYAIMTHANVAQAAGLAAFEAGWLRDATSDDD